MDVQQPALIPQPAHRNRTLELRYALSLNTSRLLNIHVASNRAGGRPDFATLARNELTLPYLGVYDPRAGEHSLSLNMGPEPGQACI
jgi:hypothetical protein